ncbi:hypothetical protein GSY71_13280 [Pusillimonas sp. TS35]|uniref:DUF6776 family protein n=1 Tax=Paracandidimonas lactea TaxID=2895524 RepID=UPI00136DC07E|nr:DUF6776 family protein [Paracandidimonas lactea]MYN14113.1 hypothetical protein [Pusillimonas sp. TS35]
MANNTPEVPHGAQRSVTDHASPAGAQRTSPAYAKGASTAGAAGSGPQDSSASGSDVARASRPHRGWLVVALCVGLVVGGLAGRYAFEAQATRDYDALKQRLEGELLAVRAQLVESQAKADALSGSLLVEESTRKGLAASLEASQAELGRTREQLAFFNQLFPPGPKGAISVRAFDAELRGNTLHYRALFMRNASGGEPFEGRLQFVAQGRQDGKAVKLTLAPARGRVPDPDAATGSDPGLASDPALDKMNAGELDLRFAEFQRSIGLLNVPDGFVPERLTLEVLEGDAVRARRTINISAGD